MKEWFLCIIILHTQIARQMMLFCRNFVAHDTCFMAKQPKEVVVHMEILDRGEGKACRNENIIAR